MGIAALGQPGSHTENFASRSSLRRRSASPVSPLLPLPVPRRAVSVSVWGRGTGQGREAEWGRRIRPWAGPRRHPRPQRRTLGLSRSRGQPRPTHGTGVDAVVVSWNGKSRFLNDALTMPLWFAVAGAAAADRGFRTLEQERHSHHLYFPNCVDSSLCDSEQASSTQ